jgi:hypothetical protein
MTSVGVFLEMLGNACMSFWWLLMAAYWNFHGQAANDLGFPNQTARTAVMVIPIVLGASFILSTFISFGRLVSYCCCNTEHRNDEKVVGGKAPGGGV